MRYSPSWSLFAVLFASAACGDELAVSAADPVTQPIIQGAECGVADYPSAVALLVDATVTFPGYGTQQMRTVMCTGTLIAPDVVLTAGHCVDPSSLTMGFGTIDSLAYFVTREPDLLALAEGRSSDFPADTIEASSWVVNPGFALDATSESTPTGLGNYGDIALVFLSESIDAVAPAVVITADEARQLAASRAVAIVGWGMQQASSNPWEQPPAGTVGEKVCATSVLNELGDFEMQIGNTGARKCHGDSGGPTYIRMVAGTPSSERVIGVTSRAYDESDCLKGGVDTRVDAWLDWIDAEMTGACERSERVWCEVAGILPPSSLPTSRGSGYGTRRRQSPDDCSQSASPSLLAGIAALLLLRRRGQARPFWR